MYDTFVLATGRQRLLPGLHLKMVEYRLPVIQKSGDLSLAVRDDTEGGRGDRG